MRLFSLLSGRVLAEVSCWPPERFLTLCAGEDIPVSRVERPAPEVLRLLLPAGAIPRLAALGEKQGFTLRILRRRGPSAGVRLFRRRRLLLLLPAALLLLVLASEGFIWEIQVEGAETVPPAAVCAALARQGLYRGAPRRGLVSETLAAAVLPELPGVSYLGVNFIGSRAVVTVREETAADNPPDPRAPAEIRAARGGVIRRLTVLEGQSAVAVGETVQPGQLLVPDRADSLSSGSRSVRAQAQVWAETERELTAAIPLAWEAKTARGAVTETRTFLLWGWRLNFDFRSSIFPMDCDKITVEENVTLLGRTLPFGWETCRTRPFETETVPRETAGTLLREHLLAELREQLGDGEILSAEFFAQERGGALFLTLRASCLEDIAEQIETGQK